MVPATTDNAAPHARIALDAVRAATGWQHRREPRSLADTPGWNEDVAALDVRDTLLERRMPEPLLKRGRAVAGASVASPGPAALQARSFALEIQRAVGSSFLLVVDTLQEPYALWHVERDRDLIHKTLHLGAGVGAAVSALTTTFDEQASDAEVPAVRWVHAACALAAEVTYMEELIAELAHLADLVSLKEKIAIQVRDARGYLDRAGRDDVMTRGGRERILTDYRDRLTRAEARQDLVHQVLQKAHGRSASGLSGARLLFGTLEQYHRIIAPLAHKAFQHPCVGEWIRAYREAVRRGEQEAVEFSDYPVPSGERLPRRTRLTIDDLDAALDGAPGPLIAPFLDTAQSAPRHS